MAGRQAKAINARSQVTDVTADPNMAAIRGRLPSHSSLRSTSPRFHRSRSGPGRSRRRPRRPRSRRVHPICANGRALSASDLEEYMLRLAQEFSLSVSSRVGLRQRVGPAGRQRRWRRLMSEAPEARHVATGFPVAQNARRRGLLRVSPWTDRAGRDRTPNVPGHELSGVVVELGNGVVSRPTGRSNGSLSRSLNVTFFTTSGSDPRGGETLLANELRAVVAARHLRPEDDLDRLPFVLVEFPAVQAAAGQVATHSRSCRGGARRRDRPSGRSLRRTPEVVHGRGGARL
jgi:hypothetical protein